MPIHERELMMRANATTGRRRYSLVAAATLVVALLGSAFSPSPASAASAEIRRVIFLGGSDVQGGTACVDRRIYLTYATYQYLVASSPGQEAWADRTLSSGNYIWTACVRGLPGYKGVYYSYAVLTGEWIGAQPYNMVTANFNHPVAGNVVLYSFLTMR
jgi:hypothetical protein